MITVQFTINDQTIQKTYESKIRVVDILSQENHIDMTQIHSCLVNNYYERLDYMITESCKVSLFDIRDHYANMAMQSGLTLLYIKAVHDILGKDVRIVIANSLSKGLFTKIHHGNVSDEDVMKISKRMKELVKLDLPIHEKTLNRKEILAYLQKKERKEELNLYRSAPDLQQAYLCELGGEEDLMYNHLDLSTKSLSLFELKKYRNGVLLRFPHPQCMNEVPVYQEQKLLYDAFSTETQWEKLLGVNYAYQLNRCVENNTYQDLIQLSEALHEKKIGEIADEISAKKKRIILISGPSSSGKTSFAKRLCVQLRVNGLQPLYLGTDDYFVNRKDVPFEKDGKQDFEGLGAVDTKLFEQQMNELLAGKKVNIPRYDFIKGEKVFGERIMSIESNQPIVIEGIHALNPELTKGIPDENKFKIYISPLTQINLDPHHRVPTTDARMLRRMVRDYRTRGNSAASTIHDWTSVREGEEKNIFPYNNQADVFFNSQCIYELAVLKKYAEPLLKGIHEEQPEYPEAQRMLQFLAFFVSIQDDSSIANHSLLREFIGGSILVK